jgi:hypothetical protein
VNIVEGGVEHLYDRFGCLVWEAFCGRCQWALRLSNDDLAWEALQVHDSLCEVERRMPG